MARKRADDSKGGKPRKGKPDPKASKPDKKLSKRSSKALVNYKLMQALAHPVRIQILAVFAERVASPKEISEELNVELGDVAYHVRALRECDLIVEDHNAPSRGAVAHFYRAAAPTLIPPSAWDNLPSAVRKGISACILQEFFDDVSASMEAGVFDDPPGELSWTPLILDQIGVEEVGQLARDFLESVLAVQVKASKRLPRGKAKRAAKATSATVFLASFLSARSPEDDRKASATKRR